MTAKVSVTLFAFGVVVTVLLIAADPVALAVGQVAGPLVISLSLALVLLAGSCLVGLSWLLWEQVKSQSAARRLTEAKAAVKEAEAQVKQAEADHLRLTGEVYVIRARFDEQVFIGQLKRGTWRNATLDPRHYANGVPGRQLPSVVERTAWTWWHHLQATQKPAEPGGAVPLIEGPPATELPQRVDLLDLMGQAGSHLSRIILGLRLDESGRLCPLVAPIWDLVHIANAGATDSGKSNLSRAIAYQCLTAGAKLAFADLKRQTFKAFNRAGNLLYPPIHTIDDFIGMVEALAAEVERRLALFERHLTVETIADYNTLPEVERLAYIVVFVDEISNIFTDKAAEAHFLALIRISRAAGIYIVAAGQSWDYRTLRTSIRQQFRTGFHFGTNDAASSRMILGSQRATEIMYQGRAFVRLPFGLAPDIVEVQTPYLDLATVVHLLDEPPDPIPPAAPRPDEQEQTILEMFDRGESYGAICRTVWGYRSSNLAN